MLTADRTGSYGLIAVEFISEFSSTADRTGSYGLTAVEFIKEGGQFILKGLPTVYRWWLRFEWREQFTRVARKVYSRSSDRLSEINCRGEFVYSWISADDDDD